MPKRRKKHPRSTEKIAEDVAFVLGIPEEQLSFNAKQAVLKNAIWCWTQYDGKIKGCKCWSDGALDSDRRNLRHEHVVPIRVLRDELLALDQATPKDVFDYLTEFAIGCVVTKEEHDRLDQGLRQSMPPGFKEGRNPFERYDQVGITVQNPSEDRG